MVARAQARLPLPLREGVGGRGRSEAACGRGASCVATPLPNPPPQGGRESLCSTVHPRAPHHARSSAEPLRSDSHTSTGINRVNTITSRYALAQKLLSDSSTPTSTAPAAAIG